MNKIPIDSPKHRGNLRLGLINLKKTSRYYKFIEVRNRENFSQQVEILQSVAKYRIVLVQYRSRTSTRIQTRRYAAVPSLCCLLCGSPERYSYGTRTMRARYENRCFSGGPKSAVCLLSHGVQFWFCKITNF